MDRFAKPLRVDREEAETIGVAALGFLAAEPQRLSRFLALTGLTPEELIGHAHEPAMLASLLEHLCGDDSLLLAFATHAGVKPDRIEPALRVLHAARQSGRAP